MAVQNTPGADDVNVVQFRIERGAEALGIDGRIGNVEQIVIDRTNGQLLALVIRGEESNTEFEMPASHVLRATGDHVYLDVSRTQLLNHPEMTAPYNPEQYVPVYQGEAIPTEAAGRVAAENETPIITDVEEDAAELVAPAQTATPATSAPSALTDERIATASAQPASSQATSGITWIPDEGAATETDTAPTMKLNRATGSGENATGWNEAVGDEQRPIPTPGLSATPETTGMLMGGKPSTGGMGTASTVPASTAPALDTVPTSPNLPPYTAEHPAPTQPPAPDTAPLSVKEAELDEGATEPTAKDTTGATMAPQSMPVTQAAVTPEAMASIPAEPLARISPPQPEGLLPPPSPQPMTAPSRQLANLRDHLPDLLLNLAKSPEMWILTGSLVTGVVGGILARRRGATPQPAARLATTSRQARRTTRGALSQAQDRLQEAQNRLAGTTGVAMRAAKTAQSRLAETATTAAASTTRGGLADQIGESARTTRGTVTRTARGTKKAAKRAVRRGRWFRRGLLLGGAGAMLFAPQRGEQTRTQLKTTLEQWRSRIA